MLLVMKVFHAFPIPNGSSIKVEIARRKGGNRKDGHTLYRALGDKCSFCDLLVLLRSPIPYQVYESTEGNTENEAQVPVLKP